MSEEQPVRPPRSRNEKREKQEEKEEKSWEEKWRRDPLNAAAWALILVWAGVVLLLSNLNLLDWFPWLEAWALFFLGAGAILLLEVGIRLALPSYRQPVLGTIILAVVFVVIGLGELISWQCLLPAAVIAVGFYLLFSSILRRRE
jgi:hypothetical protein